MREILFRGKCIATGKWVFGDLIHGVGFKKGKMFILPIMENLAYAGSGCHPLDGFEVIPEIVGQFTGSSDKNGIKIFEGDVFQWLGFEVNEGVQIRPTRKIIVEYKYDVLFGIRNIIESNGTGEVIGNIHDNPELLK